MNVSRETSGGHPEEEPPLVGDLFGHRVELARQFARNLSVDGLELGLIGPQELSRLWTRHVVNCALVAPLLRKGPVGDLGSGAGLPGLVLAIARPDVSFLLIEPMERRVHWLRSQVQILGLDNVEVLRSRAEEAQLAPKLDQLTARAVSALRRLIPISVPLLRPGGELLFLKGRNVEQEIEAAEPILRKFGLRDVEVLTLGEDLPTETTRVFRATVD